MNNKLGPDSSFDVKTEENTEHNEEEDNIYDNQSELEPGENAENKEEDENIYDNHQEFETTSLSQFNEVGGENTIKSV